MSKLAAQKPHIRRATDYENALGSKCSQQNKLDSPFSSDYIYLCAYLVCRGHQIVNTFTGDGNRTFFRFQDSELLRAAVSDFMCGGEVGARDYSLALLRLKKLIPDNSTLGRRGHALVQTFGQQQK